MISNNNKLRICYFGHHGLTPVFVELHKIWADAAKNQNSNSESEIPVEPIPSFIIFNHYWKRFVRRHFPDCPVLMLPLLTDNLSSSFISSVILKKSNDESPIFGWEFFRRGMNLDKVFRHKNPLYVKHIWNEIIKKTERFLDEQKPDFILSEAIQTLYCYAIFLCATKRKIPYIHTAGGRIKENQIEIYYDLSPTPEGFNMGSIAEPQAVEEAQRYFEKIKNPSYRTPLYGNDDKPTIRKNDIKKFFRYLSEYFYGGCLEAEGQGILHSIYYKLRAIWLKKFILSGKYYKNDISSLITGANRDKKKLLFPLHVTPEVSTDLWAPGYNDMASVASNIAQNLPEDWLLVIKEHPAVFTLQRKLPEIKKLSSIPNAVLLAPDIPNEILIKECSAFIVVTGTFGLEMMVRGLPVITLANPIYDQSGNTIPCRDIKELPQILNQTIQNLKISEENNLKFLTAFIKCLADGFLANADMYPETMDKNNLNRLSESLKARILLRKEYFVKRIEAGLKII